MQKSTERARKPADAGTGSARADALDRIDRQILKRLQQDGRLPVTQLAQEVHLTVTPCYERVRRLEADGFISGYFAHLNAQRLGLGLMAYIAVNLDQTTSDVFERFTESMRTFDEVLECHMVGGGFDYLVKVRMRDMAAYRRFLGERLGAIKGVKLTHTYFVMEEVKSSHQLAVPG
jgi:Lrp/AsnC family leucine-responsive transcriptional regulator